MVGCPQDPVPSHELEHRTDIGKANGVYNLDPFI